MSPSGSWSRRTESSILSSSVKALPYSVLRRLRCRAWANRHVNVVTIVAWASAGKTTLINHWLRRLAADNYRSAEFIFGWSFYRQGTSGDASSADEFIDAALNWF